MKKYTYKYPKADHTVDAVVFGVDLNSMDLKVLLIERGRKGEPFYGHWALPGGFVNIDEDLENAFHRELEEETGLQVSYVEQLYTFGKPDRDPRGRVISTAYLALVRPTEVVGQDDAAKAEWKSVKKLPPLAFDHHVILKMGLERLRSKVRWQPIGIGLLPKKFTLTCLQQVYEIILGYPLDRRNFRRRVLKLGVLQEVGEIDTRGRPAKMYRFDKRTYNRLQKEGLYFEV